MEVVPLGDTSVEQMRGLLDEEASHWKEQLCWDYKPTLRLVKKLIDSRTLPGFVLREAKNIIGYSYFVLDRPVGFIGGLYVRNDSCSAATYERLIQKNLQAMDSLEHLERIESQVIPFNHEFSSIFVSAGFRKVRRYFLSVHLQEQPLGSPSPSVLTDPEIEKWKPELILSAAEAIHDSYVGAPDSSICRDYQTRRGCIRFLRNLIGSPSCGKFSTEETRVAVDREGRICGILVVTRIGPDTEMIPQLSVRRECQGRGLGSLLLGGYLRSARQRNLHGVVLSVSEGNAKALTLYRRFGFQVKKTFHAFIWEKDRAGRALGY
jgi:ribosomal protein S18 acetylase RimI-like enzyme